MTLPDLPARERPKVIGPASANMPRKRRGLFTADQSHTAARMPSAKTNQLAIPGDKESVLLPRLFIASIRMNNRAMDADLALVIAALAEIKRRKLPAQIDATYRASQLAPRLLAWIEGALER